MKTEQMFPLVKQLLYLQLIKETLLNMKLITYQLKLKEQELLLSITKHIDNLIKKTPADHK